METRGLHDIAIDMVKERLTDAREIIREDYKGTRPFRVEPPSERESLYRYLTMSPLMKDMARQSFGEAYSGYEQKMESLKQKFGAKEVL